jgi:hypothetical protein
MTTMNNESDKKAIEQAIIDYYHEGHAQSDPKLYEGVLHPEMCTCLGTILMRLTRA